MPRFHCTKKEIVREIDKKQQKRTNISFKQAETMFKVIKSQEVKKKYSIS